MIQTNEQTNRQTNRQTKKMREPKTFPLVPKGTYLDVENQDSKYDCKKCEHGHFCDRPGLAHPKGKCAAGHYCDRRGATSAFPVIINYCLLINSG